MNYEKFIEDIRFHLKDGLIGGDTHRYSHVIISKLEFSDANSLLAKGLYTIYGQLYHMLYWQKLLIALLDDDDKTFKTDIELKSWPEEDCDEQTFAEAKIRFVEELGLIAEKIDTLDLSEPTPSWKDVPKYKLLQILLQHNSYHLAQIILIIKLLAATKDTQE